MIELFTNIPEETKMGAELVFDAAISTNDLVKATRILTDYTNSITDTDVLEFVEFYFNMRMESILYENNNNQR